MLDGLVSGRSWRAFFVLSVLYGLGVGLLCTLSGCDPPFSSTRRCLGLQGLAEAHTTEEGVSDR